MNKLILLKRKNPVEYEVHRNEINQTHNLLLTTKDLAFAERMVHGFNSYEQPLKVIKSQKIDKSVQFIMDFNPDWIVGVDAETYSLFCFKPEWINKFSISEITYQLNDNEDTEEEWYVWDTLTSCMIVFKKNAAFQINFKNKTFEEIS